jgi:hypothetical protein
MGQSKGLIMKTDEHHVKLNMLAVQLDLPRMNHKEWANTKKNREVGLVMQLANFDMSWIFGLGYLFRLVYHIRGDGLCAAGTERAFLCVAHSLKLVQSPRVSLAPVDLLEVTEL